MMAIPMQQLLFSCVALFIVILHNANTYSINTIVDNTVSRKRILHG